MTADDYFGRHLPHRFNLLITFRERFGPKASAPLNPETVRDLYRCAKDISMMMVRFFLEELGIKMGKQSPNPYEDTNGNLNLGRLS